jgi:acetolactate synthase-1/2/3 large subunit
VHGTTESPDVGVDAPEAVAALLAGARHLVSADADSSVSPVAHPGKPSNPVADACPVNQSAKRAAAVRFLAALAEEMAPRTAARVAAPSRLPLRTSILALAGNLRIEHLVLAHFWPL